MADRTERDLHGAHDDQSPVSVRRRGGRARLLAAAILTLALVGALVPLSALGASGSGAVTILQTATATRGTATATTTATVAGTAARTATAATTATVAGTAARTATAVPTGVGGQPGATATTAATATRPAATATVAATATAAVPAAPRAGGGGLFQGTGLAWPLAMGLALMIAAGAAVAGYRRRLS